METAGFLDHTGWYDKLNETACEISRDPKLVDAVAHRCALTPCSRVRARAAHGETDDETRPMASARAATPGMGTCARTRPRAEAEACRPRHADRDRATARPVLRSNGTADAQSRCVTGARPPRSGGRKGGAAVAAAAPAGPRYRPKRAWA
jgi:hypothetical protein